VTASKTVGHFLGSQTLRALILSRTPVAGNSPWKSHLLSGGGKTTSGPFPTTTGLGFAGFFFPLLQPMLGMVGQPAIRASKARTMARDHEKVAQECATNNLGNLSPNLSDCRTS